MIALAATVGGARTFEEIGVFGEVYEDWFRQSLRFTLANSVPRHNTIYRALVTIDAAGCAPANCQQIREKKGDYLLAAQGNQPTLHAAVPRRTRFPISDG